MSQVNQPAASEEGEIIFLNVGGQYFLTRRSTLLQSDSFFAGVVRSNPTRTELFIDRDPTYFRYVLNWMRGVKHLPDDESILQELSWEADYFCMPQFHQAIARTKNRYPSVRKALSTIHSDMLQISLPSTNG